MVLIAKPIDLDGSGKAQAYLDAWAKRTLVNDRSWRELLESARDWVDYAPRNQILLAAHGAIGPVAGAETWRLVPADDGATCVVRRGEHAMPVRVPITGPGTAQDPHLGGTRPTLSAVQDYEWRGVFCVEQLARRPLGSLFGETPGRRPDVTIDEARLAEVARAIVKQTIRGAVPAFDDPIAALAGAVQARPRSSERPALSDVLAGHTVWLAAGGLGVAAPPPAEFDPSELPARERWERALDVIAPAQQLRGQLGRAVGVDLLASPLPRMQVDDDRVVPATRRNRLPRASLEQLPLNEWFEVGPYTAAEWATRGESASGRGAYLRLNASAYLVVAEGDDGAFWRLEDTRAKTGAGVLAGGDAASLNDARSTAVLTLTERYPQLGGPIAVAERVEAIDAVTAGDAGRPAAAGVADDQQRVAASTTPLIVVPSDNTGSSDVAAERATTQGAAPRPLTLAPPAPDEQNRNSVFGPFRGSTAPEIDAQVADLCAATDYTRADLVAAIIDRLDRSDQLRLISDPSPLDLIDLVGSCGVGTETTIAVLHAECVPAEQVAPLLPAVGVSTTSAIRILDEQWSLDRSTAAHLLGASVDEMRQAGCSSAEIIATRTSEVVTLLPAKPHLWEIIGGTLAQTGETPEDIVGLLSSHAPDAACLAAGVVTAVDNPAEGLALTARRGMPSESLALCSERYGLSPSETADLLYDAGVRSEVAVGVVLARCDGDEHMTTELARDHLGLNPADVESTLVALDTVIDFPVNDQEDGLEPAIERELLGSYLSHPAARGARSSTAAALLAQLPPPSMGTNHASADLLSALPAPEPGPGDSSLLARLPEPIDPSLSLSVDG